MAATLRFHASVLSLTVATALGIGCSGATDAATVSTPAVVECPKAECGPAPGTPSTTCADGSAGGATGRCVRKESGGACGWEVRDCPSAKTFACGAAACLRGKELCRFPRPSGAADSGPSSAAPSCEPLPEKCVGTPTCACVQEQLGCGGGSSAYCDDGGDLSLSGGCTGL